MNKVVSGLARHLLMLLITSCYSFSSFAHDKTTYLGNSAVLVESGGKKLLFDPFFHNDFGHYRLVPKDIHNAMMAGEAPWDNIDAIFISHAHEDHFSAEDVFSYLRRFPKTLLFAPHQAVQQIASKPGFEVVQSRVYDFALDFNATTETKTVSEFKVMATRIPHAGWPGRKDVENLVFRVFIEGGKSTMHMGDADPNDDHYLPYKADFQQNKVDINFPPYWFFMSAEGRDILDEIIKADQSVGVHAPKILPGYLKEVKLPFFQAPLESKIIE